MLYLRLPPGKAAGLGWPALDFDKAIIYVWPSRISMSTGGHHRGNQAPGSTQSLDAPPVVIEALRRIAFDGQSDGERRRRLREPAGTRVHVTDRSANRSQAVRTQFNEDVASSGIEGWWTPNLLRQSAASLMADEGMPNGSVADQLGRHNLRMLQKHHRHRIKPTVDGGKVLGGSSRPPRAP